MKTTSIVLFALYVLNTLTVFSQSTTKSNNLKNKTIPVSTLKSANKTTNHTSENKNTQTATTPSITNTEVETKPVVKTDAVVATAKNEDNPNSKDFYHESYKTRNSGSFNKGRSLISVGYGLPNWLYSGYGVAGYLFYSNFKTHRFGPLMLKYEYGIMDEVGVSAMFQYATKSWTYGSAYTYKDKATGIGGTIMGNYHFNKFIPIKKLDVYASVGCSVTFEALEYDPLFYQYYYGSYYPAYQPANESNVVVRPVGIIGARYYLNKHFAGFLELGSTTLSSINAGITLGF